MGWTDNGKIMPPWITLSERRETKSEEDRSGRDAGTEWAEAKSFSKELQSARCRMKKVMEQVSCQRYGRYACWHRLQQVSNNSFHIESLCILYCMGKPIVILTCTPTFSWVMQIEVEVQKVMNNREQDKGGVRSDGDIFRMEGKKRRDEEVGKIDVGKEGIQLSFRGGIEKDRQRGVQQQRYKSSQRSFGLA